MKINHQWKEKKPGKERVPKYIPVEQHAAIVAITKQNAYDFAMQLCTEMSMLALAEEFQFGEQRLTRYVEALNREICHFVDSVQWEFDSETLGMKVKEKAEKRPDLDYTLTELDERIRKVVPEGTFKPYRERYGKFGGKGSWCE